MRFTRPVTPDFPCDPTTSLSSQQPTARHAFDSFLPPTGGTLYTHTPIDRQSLAFPPRRRVRVAQYFYVPGLPGLGMGSKEALQSPAPQRGCTSFITSMQLPQSEPIWRSILDVIRRRRLVQRRGGSLPSLKMWQAIISLVLAVQENFIHV